MNQLPVNPELVQAAFVGDLNLVEEFLKQGADINSVDATGRTSLHAACEAEQLEMIKYLLASGADIDAYDSTTTQVDPTPFLYAAAHGLEEVIKILHLYRPNGRILNSYGGTALIPACEKGYVKVVRLILDNFSIDVNHVNDVGWTALQEAIVLGDGGPNHVEIVKLLLEHGANPDITDPNGITPLQYAKNNGYEGIVRAFSEFFDEQANKDLIDDTQNPFSY